MFRRPLLLMVAVLIGFICEFIYSGGTVTFLFPALILVCLALGWVGLLIFNLLPARGSALLFLPPVIFAILASITAAQPESLKYVLSMAFTFLYLGLLTMTYRGGRLSEYSLFDYGRNSFRLGLSLVGRPILFFWQWWQDITASSSSAASTVGTSIAWGRAIAVLTFAALFVLFWWADALFRALPRVIFEFIRNRPSALNIPGILVWSYLILGMLLHAGTQSRDLALTVDNPAHYFRRWFNYNISAAVFITVLVPLVTFSVIRLFGLYNWDQYIQDAQTFPLPMEVRFGFWVMVGVVAACFMVAGWLNHVTVFDNDMDRFVHTILNFFLFSNVCVVLWTAWQSVSRVTMGIRAVRHVWYARMGLVWLGVMFLLFVIAQAIHRERDFPFAALLVTTAMVLGFVMLAILFASIISI